MKKFIDEYKATKCKLSKSETDSATRERVTVTTHHSVTPGASTSEQPFTQHSTSATQIGTGTIRTEEYKRDLAEFQARRSTGTKELAETPEKLKRCGRHSLPVSCTDCASDHDNTFNYEKKSAVKYKKNKRSRSITPEKIYEGVPNIQFLFQNQVFMPGHYTSFSEPQKSKRQSRRSICRSPDFVQKHIDFKESDRVDSPPEFFRNNSLPFDVRDFLEGSRNDEEEVDGLNAADDVPSHDTNKNERDDNLWEVMSELKHLDQWADELLQPKSPNTNTNTSRSDDSKSDTSAYGLPVASARNLDINSDNGKIWNHGRWGVVPVQIKKLTRVTIDHVRKKRSIEINILRKCRHPNIILLMGIYPDINNNVHIICERCTDSLFGILHVQGRILSAQTAVQYTLDIANAVVFLQMQGFIHTQLNSMSIMITSHDSAKLADLGPCMNIDKGHKSLERVDKDYEVYAAEPQYVNIEDTHGSKTSESELLLSANPSETYLKKFAVSKPYEDFQNSELYRWQAPEMFVPDEVGKVYPCSKSDAYSLSLILWESCNASIPWKMLTYEKLKEQYTMWETGMSLPQDGTYPGCLLSLLQSGLKIKRNERIDLEVLQQTLQTVKRDINDIGYIIIPARLQNKKSSFSTTVWDTTSPTDSDCQSPQNIEHKAVIHNTKDTDSSTETSEKETKSDEIIPLYETIKRSYSNATYSVAQKCVIPDDDDKPDCETVARYELLPEKGFSSACSTPIAKLRARIKDVQSPGALHKSDSTEYCSILSPNRTANLGLNDESNKDHSCERSTSKLSRSFTPKSYKPLHIKVPEYNLESIKPLLKDHSSIEKSSYNFDIKNYSLPSTPIARSNKLRKNAWLSGDFGTPDKTPIKKDTASDTTIKEGRYRDAQLPPESPETQPKSSSCSPEIVASSEINSATREGSTEHSPASTGTVRDSVSGHKRSDPNQDFSPETDETRERTWSFKSSLDRNNPKYKVDEDVLASMNVKPLVAIHEKWIYEANRKSGRSMSLPEDNSFRTQVSAVKPASHCVDTLQKSLPQLNMKKPTKAFRMSASPNSNGGHWEQFCQARDTIAKGLNFAARDPERYHTWSKDLEKGTATEDRIEPKVDQATDTKGIEEFIRDLIRKEFQHLLHEVDHAPRNEDVLNKGVANIMESLNEENLTRKEPIKFSRVKINGNNKPLLQITFNRSGDNSLQVLDNCVNVTICDSGRDSSNQKLNVSLEDTLTEDVQTNTALKRCQAFNAIQEARSTEDLYIDDDLSTHMNENFGGKVKLIPLHGSLHEILCEKEDDCCLIKVKQENGCDTIYFRCDNSDTESRDAIDGCSLDSDTVVFKRSISLIEERIQRIIPKEKRTQIPVIKRIKKDAKVRPKSEIFAPIKRETRFLSNSTPSLAMNDEVEVNIENVMSYQDSSSDECINLKCQDDDFELLEKKIEEDMASNMTLGCGCLEKISEENLSVLNEETTDTDSTSFAEGVTLG